MSAVGARRVVVVGMGLRSPIGNTLAEFAESLVSGKHGVRAMPEWDAVKNLHTKLGGVCRVGEAEVAGVPRKNRRTMGRVAILAALAARDAVAASGLAPEDIASPSCGVAFGSTAGSMQGEEEFMRRLLATGDLLGMQSSAYLTFMSHTCAANLAVMFECKGPLLSTCSACTSGSQGVGAAYDAIRAGRARWMIAGGAEEMHMINAAVFDIFRATSTKYNDRPDESPRPFDAERDGLVVGEGAGALVLEEFESARRRGANIVAEVLGYATNCSGAHLTNSDPAGIEAVMRLALADARLDPDRIAYVNAHATATEIGDQAEAEAAHRVFGARTPISSLKGFMGHTLGASGAIESIATILMIREGFMAPTRNLRTPDPRLPPLDHVIGDARRERFMVAMNNNFAFGGVNTSLIFGAF